MLKNVIRTRIYSSIHHTHSCFLFIWWWTGDVYFSANLFKRIPKVRTVEFGFVNLYHSYLFWIHCWANVPVCSVNSGTVRLKMFVKFWILVILLLVCAIFLIHYLIRFNRRKKRILKYVGHLQSPPELPIVGSGLLFLGKNTDGMYGGTVQKRISNYWLIESSIVSFVIHSLLCRNNASVCGFHGSIDNTILCMVWRYVDFSYWSSRWCAYSVNLEIVHGKGNCV